MSSTALRERWGERLRRWRTQWSKQDDTQAHYNPNLRTKILRWPTEGVMDDAFDDLPWWRKPISFVVGWIVALIWLVSWLFMVVFRPKKLKEQRESDPAYRKP